MQVFVDNLASAGSKVRAAGTRNARVGWGFVLEVRVSARYS